MAETRSRLMQLRQAIHLVGSSAPGWTLLQVVLVGLQGVLPVAALLLTRRVVDAVGGYLGQAPGDRAIGPLLEWVPWIGLVAAAGWLCRAGSTLVAQAQADAVADRVQDDMQAKSVELDLQVYEKPAFHDQVRLVHAEAMSRPVSLVRNLVQLGSGLLILGAVGGVLWATQGFLLPMLVLAALPGTLARVRNSRRWIRWRLAHSSSERYAGYLHQLLTSLPFAKEIRLHGTGPDLRRRHRLLRGRLRRSRRALMANRAAADLLADAVSAAVVVATLGVLYVRIRSQAMTLGDLALLAGGFQKGKAGLAGVLASVSALYEDSLFITRFHDFMALPRRVDSPAHPRRIPDPMRQGLRLDNVSFCYPGTEVPVLHNLNLELHPGELAALVGENGSGKTTLVKLLCRLYDPSAGRILFDGVDLREFELESWRRQCATLFQDFVRYQMTAAENVRMGAVEVAPGDPRIAEAIRLAGAESLVARLPRGLETPLGRLFEGGAELSEGQWQRIALARALLRPAPLLLLDEPTSALDPRAERELLEALLRHARDRTALVVSHRFSTVQAADRILVLSEGRLVEAGAHADLVRRNGTYARLFSLHQSE